MYTTNLRFLYKCVLFCDRCGINVASSINHFLTHPYVRHNTQKCHRFTKLLAPYNYVCKMKFCIAFYTLSNFDKNSTAR